MSHCRSISHSLSRSPLIRQPSVFPLSFLYQTRSIRHRHSRPPPRGDTEDIPFDFTHSAADQQSSSTEDSDPFSYLYQAPPKKPRLVHGGPSLRADVAPPPYGSTASRTRPQSLAGRRRGGGLPETPPSSSSITLREREIFTRIFESILATPTSTQDKPPAAASSIDALPRARGLPPPPALTELFTSTIGPQRTGSNISFGPQQSASEREGATAAMALASKVNSYPPSLRAAAARAAGLKDWANPATEMGMDLGLLEHLKNELRACKSDHALLRWMNEHVFALAEDPSEEKSGFYAELLAVGMDTFRKTYNDLGAVVAVFEKAKKLGAESYVLGCTSQVYNRVLAAVWDGFADFQHVRELVEEMRVNAVGGDGDTVKVMRRVCRELEKTYDGHRGEMAAMTVGKKDIRGVDVMLQLATRLETTGTLEAPLVMARPADRQEKMAIKKRVKEAGRAARTSGQERRRPSEDFWGDLGG